MKLKLIKPEVFQTEYTKSGKPKIKRLPKKNGVIRKSASLSVYQYQKDELKKRAKAKGMSVSYYLNYVLWSEWL